MKSPKNDLSVWLPKFHLDRPAAMATTLPLSAPPMALAPTSEAGATEEQLTPRADDEYTDKPKSVQQLEDEPGIEYMSAPTASEPSRTVPLEALNDTTLAVQALDTATAMVVHMATNIDLHDHIATTTYRAEERSRELARARRDLSKRTEAALKAQRKAAEDKQRRANKERRLAYEAQLVSHRVGAPEVAATSGSEVERGFDLAYGLGRIQFGPPAAAAAVVHESEFSRRRASREGKLAQVDPKIEHMRKMRELEEEKEEAMREQAALLAAKDAAFEKAKKEEAYARQQVVLAAQREVAATFKKNQEKELAAKNEREAAEKEKNRLLAKEALEKVNEQTRKDLEAERAAAADLKRSKARQYAKNNRVFQRNEKKRVDTARHRRDEQTAMKDARTAWESMMSNEESERRNEARRLFNEQQACKRAEEEELRQSALLNQTTITLLAEEARAQMAAKDMEKVTLALQAAEDMVGQLVVQASGGGAPTGVHNHKAASKARRRRGLAYTPSSLFSASRR